MPPTRRAARARWLRSRASRACELVIEAAPERPDLKRELFGRLSEVCGDQAILATNTSSIPVTSIAGADRQPENVVGMHFFNPPPLMELLEVIRADQTGERAVDGRAGGRRGDGQDGHPRGRRPRLPGEPLRPPVRRRGAAAAAGAGGHARADRPHLPARRRLPDGPVRADGPRGRGRGLRGRASRSPSCRSASRAGGRARSRRGWWRRGGSAGRRRAATTTTRTRAPTGPPIPSRSRPAAATAASRRRSRARRRSPTGCARARSRPASSSPRASEPRSWRTPEYRASTTRGGAGLPVPGSCAVREPSLAASGEQGACGFHLLPPLDGVSLVELTRTSEPGRGSRGGR